MIKLNQDRCISCKACEVHCKMKNKVPAGARFSRIITHGPVGSKTKPKLKNLYMPCFHCAQPWCVSACPTNAMTMRDEDGIVYVQEDLCVGCKACIMACPWMIPQWNDETGKAVKCDYCMDFVDEGRDPACVSGCTAHALTFIRPNTASDKVREKFAKKILEK